MCFNAVFPPPLYLFLHQGERLSHAVGCAFAACLERKQRREKECGVTASFDASRTSFVREGSFRANSSCSQQGSSSEREDKLQEKRKGRSFFLFQLHRQQQHHDIYIKTVLNSSNYRNPFFFQTSPLSCRPFHLAPPPHPRVRPPLWSDQNQAGLMPSPAATRPLNSWCVKAHSEDFRPSVRRILPSRGSCHSVSMICHPHYNARQISRPRTLVSGNVFDVILTNVDIC